SSPRSAAPSRCTGSPRCPRIVPPSSGSTTRKSSANSASKPSRSPSCARAVSFRRQRRRRRSHEWLHVDLRPGGPGRQAGESVMTVMKTVPARRVLDTRLPTERGMFRILGYEREIVAGGNRGEIETAIALVLGDLAGEPPLLRIHSQCFTGEMLGSL